MGELKQHQLPMTIDEQIENLKSLGLIIENEEYAKKILNDISYFRLIKAYSLGFKPKNGKYEEGVTFEQIVELYLFNANFRQVTFVEIEKNRSKCQMQNCKLFCGSLWSSWIYGTPKFCGRRISSGIYC